MRRLSYLLILGLLSGNLAAGHAGSLISGAHGGYRNEAKYDEPIIEWLDPGQSIESRVALLHFAGAYLKFTQSLGPSFQKMVKVNISGKSAGEAIAQLEKITGTSISRKIISPDPVKISLKGMDTGTGLLLKIIALSGMTPSFESGVLVLSAPQKIP